MKTSIKLNRTIIFELLAILCLWLISVKISSSIFARPLDTHLEYLTARTLVNLRAFEEWGFWQLLGGSVLVPKSHEFLNADITSLSFVEGVRLGYPTFWLILPYVIFKLLNLVNLNISLSNEYIQIYNLVFDRLICGIVIYYLYSEILKIIFGNKFSNFQNKLFSFLGLVGWMFTPPVLYWTQNVYLTDQAVLLPIYALFLISLKCSFKFEALSKPGKVLLFVVSLLTFGLDWYGWVVAAIILFIVFIEKSGYAKKNSILFKDFFRDYLKSTKFILLPGLLVVIIFFVQLSYYDDGIDQLIGRFLRRTGLRPVTDNSEPSVPFLDSVKIILSYWVSYLPGFHSYFYKVFFPSAYKNLTFASLVLSVLIIISIISFVLISLFYLYQKSQDKRLTIYSYIFLFLAPILQIFFLRQHSYRHDFSALKMALPVTFSLIIVPIILLYFLLKKSQLIPQNINSHKITLFTLILVLVLGLFLIYKSKDKVIEFAGKGTSVYQDLGKLIPANIAYNELAISDDALGLPPDSWGLWVPPQALWYTDRFLYSPEAFTNQSLQANTQNFKDMKPVFLVYKDKLSETSVQDICQNKWVTLPEKIIDREVVACRIPELNRLLVPPQP